MYFNHNENYKFYKFSKENVLYYNGNNESYKYYKENMIQL